MPKVEWSDVPSGEYDEKALSTLSATVTGPRMTLTGKCPRCGDEMEYQRPLEIVTGIVAETAAKVVEFDARCRCGHDHPDTPEGQEGCGAPFSVRVRYEGDGAATLLPVNRPTSAARQEEEKLLAELDAKQLETTRASAEGWRGGLAGLLAIVTTAGFVKGKESVDDLATVFQVLLALVFLGAVAAGAAATYRALRAAKGSPRKWTTEEIERAGGVRAWQHRLALLAAEDLREAQKWAFLSMTLLACAVLITWFGGTADVAKLKVTAGGSQPVCGTSQGVADGTLTLKVDGGEANLALSEVSALSVGC